MKLYIAAPAIFALVYRAYSHRSLTPLGLIVAALTAIAHAVHPWSIFFTLLAVFFLTGSSVTKVKHAQKSALTITAAGGLVDSKPPPRTHVQVLANSFAASLMILLHSYHLSSSASSTPKSAAPSTCLQDPALPHSFFDVLPYAIFSHYAAVASDTFSSELGILSSSRPVLITAIPSSLLSFRWPAPVPPGTNGGVTALGFFAGVGGGAIIALVSVLVAPFCSEWTLFQRLVVFIAVTVAGAAGTILDSLLGAVAQASVVEGRTGKVVEGEGGAKVLFNTKGGGGRKLVAGRDLLSNNGVNFAMAAGISVLAWIGGSIVLS